MKFGRKIRSVGKLFSTDALAMSGRLSSPPIMSCSDLVLQDEAG
jgi:hypothetical protein